MDLHSLQGGNPLVSLSQVGGACVPSKVGGEMKSSHCLGSLLMFFCGRGITFTTKKIKHFLLIKGSLLRESKVATEKLHSKHNTIFFFLFLLNNTIVY